MFWVLNDVTLDVGVETGETLSASMDVDADDATLEALTGTGGALSANSMPAIPGIGSDAMVQMLQSHANAGPLAALGSAKGGRAEAG
eukprot:788105-Alexandrium_andersonii.AAC.1